MKELNAKRVFVELCDIYGTQSISVRTILGRVLAFKAGKMYAKDRQTYWHIRRQHANGSEIRFVLDVYLIC